jgi:hypothetical protein
MMHNATNIPIRMTIQETMYDVESRVRVFSPKMLKSPSCRTGITPKGYKTEKERIRTTVS